MSSAVVGGGDGAVTCFMRGAPGVERNSLFRLSATYVMERCAPPPTLPGTEGDTHAGVLLGFCCGGRLRASGIEPCYDGRGPRHGMHVGREVLLCTDAAHVLVAMAAAWLNRVQRAVPGFFPKLYGP